MALTTPDTTLIMAVITLGGTGVGGVTTDNCSIAWVAGVRSAVVSVVGSVRSATTIVLTTSAGSSCVVVTSDAASSVVLATVDTGGGDSVLVGLAVVGSDFLDGSGSTVVSSSASGGDGATVSVGGVSGVGSGSPSVSPPVLTTTPGGAERSSSSVVVVVVPASSCLEGSAPDSALVPVEPVVPADSSAQAGPLFHPVTMAAPRLRATAKPPTRLRYAPAGMRHV